MALKLGIIGNGGIANCHADGYLQLGDEIEFIACCDIDEKKAADFAKKYGFKKYYTDCRKMVAECELDVVSVCTWNSAHAECTIAALEAGCNVICEKPMAMNAAEAQRMKEAADKAGKLLMLGFVRRQGNDARNALRLIENGELGDIYYAKASYLRRAGFPGGWFGDKSRSGGGPLIDLGVHVIDLARFVMGCPKPVSAFGATFDKIGARDELDADCWKSETNVEKPVFDVEDLAVAMIRFDNGSVLSVEASFNLNIKNGSGDLEFFGDKAGLSFTPFELHTVVNNSLADISLHGDNNFDFTRDFRREIKNFVDAVSGRAECLAPAEDGVILMKILDAVYLSAATGKSVEINT